MDWGSVVFGAFLGVAGTFGLVALALYPVMRRAFLLWIFARTLAFCVLALAMIPAKLQAIVATGIPREDVGDVAVAISVAFSGPLLASYIEPHLRLAGVRRWLHGQLGLGLLAALATFCSARWPWLGAAHDLLLLGAIGISVAALAIAIRAGSRAARFQAFAWAPLILVGVVALGHELVVGRAIPFWATAALLAVTVDFIVTSVGVIDGFMIIKHQRDEAVADVRAARIAVATDPLTGIANRRGLARRFRDPAHDRPRGLTVIDCDHFKRINDMFGHDVGDEVLIAVARGLQQEGVFAARQGGEEFVALLYGEDWQRRAEAVRRQIPISVLELVPEVPFPVTASAGLTEICPEDSLDTAVKRADRALYAAKDAGRDRLLVQLPHGAFGPHLLRSA